MREFQPVHQCSWVRPPGQEHWVGCKQRGSPKEAKKKINMRMKDRETETFSKDDHFSCDPTWSNAPWSADLSYWHREWGGEFPGQMQTDWTVQNGWQFLSDPNLTGKGIFGIRKTSICRQIILYFKLKSHVLIWFFFLLYYFLYIPYVNMHTSLHAIPKFSDFRI